MPHTIRTSLGRLRCRFYAGNIELACRRGRYLNGQIQHIAFPDGRLVAEYDAGGASLEGYRAEYFRTDHLGNTRLTFSDFNQDGVISWKLPTGTRTPYESEITSENHYYPFGLGQSGPWYASVAPENKYRYNGKEWNDDWGLNMYDYGARGYMPDLGRWGGVDALAERYYAWSGYNYVANNPLRFIDPDGKRIDVESNTKKNGKEKVTITYTGVVETDGANLSVKEVRQLTKMIKQQIKSSFSGSGDNVRWKTNVNLRILGEGQEASADDNRIILTNSSSSSLDGRTGAAPNGFDAYVDTEGRSLRDIARTAAHEVGHNMGLPHNVHDSETITQKISFGNLNKLVFLEPNTIQKGHPAAGNLMLPGTQVNAAGTNITPSQIRHIVQDSISGKLNSRTVSGGDEAFGVYSTDKPIVNIYGQIIRN